MDMWSIMKRGFMYRPDRDCVIFGEQRVTYREFEARLNRLVNLLYGLGLEKGDRISVLSENSMTATEAMIGVEKSGMVWAPLNFRHVPAEHVYHLNNAGSKAVIMQQQFAEGIASVRDELETVEHFIVDGEGFGGMDSYEDLMAKASDRPTVIDIDENDPVALMYTSGTTGKAKGVLHTHKSFGALATFSAIELGVQADDVVVYVAPINHGAGILLPPHLMMGVPNILISHLDVDYILDVIQKEGVTTMWLAPTIIYFLLAYPNRANFDLSSLRSLPYSSAPIAVEKLKEALDVFGNVFAQAYGLVECPVITMLAHDDHVVGGSEEQTSRLGSAGREIIYTRVRVVDSGGNDMPVGETGEIIVNSPLVMKEYWRDPEATAETLRDGWLYTGDVGYLDEGGYLFIADRLKDLIITGGYNVYPKEVENVIFKHEAVFEAAVIGVPDETWGESVKAFVALKPGMQATEEEIIQLCKDNLASYKKPKSVEFVDALPKNMAGKILKTELRAPYWEGRERQV
jgi:acyl-CoA synthetase (AMP-forming)/AMP-acid ligase II